MSAKAAIRVVSSVARPLATSLLTLALGASCACTRTEGTSAKPLGEATPHEGEQPKAQGWRENQDLERSLERLGLKKDAAENLSDAALLAVGAKTYLVVVSDEGHDFALTTLGKDAESKVYDLAGLPYRNLGIELPSPKSDVEVDIEAVTVAGDRVFLIGSASLKRKKPKDGGERWSCERSATSPSPSRTHSTSAGSACALSPTSEEGSQACTSSQARRSNERTNSSFIVSLPATRPRPRSRRVTSRPSLACRARTRSGPRRCSYWV